MRLRKHIDTSTLLLTTLASHFSSQCQPMVRLVTHSYTPLNLIYTGNITPPCGPPSHCFSASFPAAKCQLLVPNDNCCSFSVSLCGLPDYNGLTTCWIRTFFSPTESNLFGQKKIYTQLIYSQERGEKKEKCDDRGKENHLVQTQTCKLNW